MIDVAASMAPNANLSLLLTTIRIATDPGQDLADRLLPGMSVVVSVKAARHPITADGGPREFLV